MAKINVSKELITSIANQENSKFVNNTTKKISQILSVSLQKLSGSVSYVSTKNVVLQPMNELLSGAVIDNSSFIYFLGIENAQLEINTSLKSNFWKNFKQNLKYAWANRKSYKKKRKRKKKKDKELALETNFDFDPNKYTLSNLAEDLQTAMLEYLAESSLVYLSGNMLQIIGKEDFGANTRIIIYLVCSNETNFKYYAGKKKGFIDVNVIDRYNILENKIKAVGDNFIKMLKVFNALYYNTNGVIPNQVFMESVLCSCPEDLFYGEDVYKIFVKLVNYIAIKSLRNIKSNNNPKKTIFEDDICGNSAIGFNRMLTLIANK